ncbi:hypothetical protein HA402_012655 [Bradysia odoriphaga]|nr:hypothetical protein HA402_012655 [Bradysia odoriphaga]
MGKSGKDGVTCENRGIDVRIDVELKKVVFIFLPLHHSFSSKFTILNHINSSQCSPEYVRNVNNETTTVESTETYDVDIASSILHYKMFLLENMKNESWKSMAQEMYKAIDEDRDLNNYNSLRGLLLEACELEKRFFELKETINLIPFYRQLYDRVENYNPPREDEDEKHARWRLRSIIEFKLNDVEREDNLIVNLEVYTTVALSIMNIRNQRLSTMPQFSDEYLQNRLNQLQFEVNGKFMLEEYEHVIKAFQLTYFPFAVQFFETYNMSTSLSDYKNLDDIYFGATNKISSLDSTVQRIQQKNEEIMMNLNYIDYNSPMNAFFVWNHSDIHDSVHKLLAGEKITLLADIKRSRRRYNAMKFNKIDLYFRSSDEDVTDRLNIALQRFEVQLTHNGVSSYRCNNNFYQIVTAPLSLYFSFKKDKHDVPLTRVGTYDMLLHNQPVLSPYASWEIQIVSHRGKDVSQLARFNAFPIDIELHGTGKFVAEDVPICDNDDLAKAFTQI